MANDGETTLRIAIGDYPHTLPLKRGEITSPSLKLDFVEVKPMHKAFKPMVREHAYDVSEMALVTYLQARAFNKGLRLLPAAMLARFQHGCMLFNAERGKLDPAGLPGCRVGVRSYSQTTGAWLRGILQNDYAADLSRVQWVTFEEGHVAEAKDPSGVIRAAAGRDMTKMLIDGELDAAICGADLPDDPRLQSVIPEPETAARPGAGQSYGGGDRDPGAVEAAGGRRTLSAAGSRQGGVRPSGCGCDRYRSFRQGGQPAVPRTADVLCGPAAADSAPIYRRRALVSQACSCEL
jgi:hypothetical protein